MSKVLTLGLWELILVLPSDIAVILAPLVDVPLAGYHSELGGILPVISPTSGFLIVDDQARNRAQQEH